MSDETAKKLLEHVRKHSPLSIAEDILSVQPMGKDVQDAMQTILEYGKTAQELIAEGYRPVSSIGLVWVKDETNS
jgi:hypothetical protein